tara:strand:- start:1639 stop:2286 length:648 start_codon:yes stop_codon:yes gene_type:complete
MEIIGIIDYGSGNIHSATKAFEKVAKDLKKEIKVMRVNNAADIKRCDRIVLPGVGAFKDCKAGINNIEALLPTLEKKILDEGAPFLGICVGMQLLADEGFEGEQTAGFGWIPGLVDKIPAKMGLKIPHMGWNNIELKKAHSIFNELDNNEEMIAYFVHSYYFQVKKIENLLGYCDYGSKITAIIGKDNIIGCQFHPEKSQKIGLKFIKSFMNWRP